MVLQYNYRCLSSLLVVIIATVLPHVNAQDPEITREILPEIRRVGTTGRLNCTVTQQNDNKVYWIMKKRDFTITSDDKVIIDPNLNPTKDGYHKYEVKRYRRGDYLTYTIIIRRLELDDAGFYTCKIQVKGTVSHPQKDGKLVVLIPPAIKKRLTTQTLTIKEGDNLNLTCSADGYPRPNITWMRPNGRPLPSPVNKFLFRGSDLAMKNLGREAHGVYRCLADNNVRPPAKHDTTVYVQYTPYAKAVQSSYGQAQNRMFDIILECRISGLPAPSLRWFKLEADGKKEMRDDDKHKLYVLVDHGGVLSVNEYWFQLEIINVQANDYGDYACEGRNNVGSHEAIVNLYETSECQGANCMQGGVTTGCAGIKPSLVALALTLLSVLTFRSFIR